MRKFTVSPDELRHAADDFTSAAETTETNTSIPVLAHLGHPRLASAVRQLMQSLTGGWGEAVVDTESLSTSLRATADLYQRADADGQSDLAAVGEAS